MKQPECWGIRPDEMKHNCPTCPSIGSCTIKAKGAHPVCFGKGDVLNPQSIAENDCDECPFQSACWTESQVKGHFKSAALTQNTRSIADTQKAQKVWATRNFGPQPAYRSLLGVQEELGELCHAHLKAEQGIRVNEDHQAAKKDAIGDIVIYLMSYCNAEGFDLVQCVTDAWAEVELRDWQKNKENGRS